MSSSSAPVTPTPASVSISVERLAQANPVAASALALSLIESDDPGSRAQGVALAEPCLRKSFAQKSPDAAGARLFAKLLCKLDAPAAAALIAGREPKIASSLSRLLPQLDEAGVERLGESLPQALAKATAVTLAASPCALRWIETRGLLSDELLERLCCEFTMAYSRGAAAEDHSAPRRGWEWLCSERSERVEAFFTAWASKPDKFQGSELVSRFMAPLLLGPAHAIAGRAIARSGALERPDFLPSFLDCLRGPTAADLTRAFCSTLFARLKADPELKARADQAFAQGAIKRARETGNELPLEPPRGQNTAIAPLIFTPSGWSDFPMMIAAENLPVMFRSGQLSKGETLITARIILAALKGMREGDPSARLTFSARRREPDRSGNVDWTRDYGHAGAHVALLAFAQGLQPGELAESAGRFPVSEDLLGSLLDRMRLAPELRRQADVLIEAATLNALSLGSKKGKKAKPAPPPAKAHRL